MKFVALISGGKDSFFNIYHCLSQGHELVAIGNLYPQDESIDEIDSFMFQTVGHDIIDYYSQCLEVPLYRQKIVGKSSNQNLEYSHTQNDEIEDLFKLLSTIKRKHSDIEGVSCGAILSHYQRTRVENVCDRLGLTSLTYLWQRNQNDLMLEMCESGLDARLIKVAAIGLNAKHLGKPLQEVYPHLLKLNQMYDVHICGEGGEFETIVLDCPFFKTKKLEIVEQKVVTHPGDVFYLKLKVQIVDKQESSFPLLSPPPLLEHGLADATQSDHLHDDVAAPSPMSTYSTYTPSVSVVDTPSKLFVSNITSNVGTVEGQTEGIFKHLHSILKEYALTFNDIQHVNVLLSDMTLFARMNKIYATFFADIYLPPSRICLETEISTTIQVSCIILKKIHPKTGIHVRSRSYWAPQNIGPYSQSIIDLQRKYKLASLSGQIPLIPATMTISENNIAFNTALSLQHLDRVEEVIGVTNPASIICFVTNSAFVPIVVDCWNHYADTRERVSTSLRENLVIAEVSALPRSADVEWGGFSCEELCASYDDDDDDDDDEAATIFEEPKFDSFEYYNTCSIANGSYRFISLFTSDINVVQDFLKNQSSFVTLLTSEFLQHSQFEYFPVRKVYNVEGKEYKFCLIVRQEESSKTYGG
ncbi:hypothetical protein CANMA_004899 [Candida margitis]|uniref:uncharacterized protein n=1 Tax=Candida margitis TaxID=1775924 RepID=UPI002226BF54|nr:uncharacterized protein CANMA_004899 [Candida margitis]KAI5954060.1 hypothetical protein CANMA_004899 [Candida margitis]